MIVYPCDVQLTVVLCNVVSLHFQGWYMNPTFGHLVAPKEIIESMLLLSMVWWLQHASPELAMETQDILQKPWGEWWLRISAVAFLRWSDSATHDNLFLNLSMLHFLFQQRHDCDSSPCLIIDVNYQIYIARQFSSWSCVFDIFCSYACRNSYQLWSYGNKGGIDRTKTSRFILLNYGHVLSVLPWLPCNLSAPTDTESWLDYPHILE